ncbi:hypothetical protein [Paenibacillus hexagrammi]|uniref:Glycosyltransferase n=1 Tax=Paenibacillus hexagrammi TaxID=2908839 RepID=A0ABY3SJC0_9BACL|nr:hypothetical protein [Paenibacillus sp. YPD9-1]UJF33235.1 hypothetical protein L0M14_27495 [Paenibacillus sp. YPD9-1]
MWIGLLWIVGCYGISIAVLHILFGTRKERSRNPARVLVITKNNENQIEWYLRSLFFFSRFKGRELQTTILDEGSSDDTIKIIERLSHTHSIELGSDLAYRSVDDYLGQHEKDSVIVVNLSNQTDLAEIPFVT